MPPNRRKDAKIFAELATRPVTRQCDLQTGTVLGRVHSPKLAHAWKLCSKNKSNQSTCEKQGMKKTYAQGKLIHKKKSIDILRFRKRTVCGQEGAEKKTCCQPLVWFHHDGLPAVVSTKLHDCIKVREYSFHRDIPIRSGCFVRKPLEAVSRRR